jgi:hypothetical protein
MMSKPLLDIGDTFKRGDQVFELVTISGQDTDGDGQDNFRYEFITKEDADANRKINAESAKTERKLAQDRAEKRALLVNAGYDEDEVAAYNDLELAGAIAEAESKGKLEKKA